MVSLIGCSLCCCLDSVIMLVVSVGVCGFGGVLMMVSRLRLLFGCSFDDVVEL